MKTISELFDFIKANDVGVKIIHDEGEIRISFRKLVDGNVIYKEVKMKNWSVNKDDLDIEHIMKYISEPFLKQKN